MKNKIAIGDLISGGIRFKTIGLVWAIYQKKEDDPFRNGLSKSIYPLIKVKGLFPRWQTPVRFIREKHVLKLASAKIIKNKSSKELRILAKLLYEKQ